MDSIDDWSPPRASRRPASQEVDTAPLAPPAPRPKFGSLEWIEQNNSRCAQCGWLSSNYGELKPVIIDDLRSKGYKVERIVHNDYECERTACCDACYRTNIMRVSWAAPTSPHFYEAQTGYCDGTHAEINRVLEQMNTAKENFTVVDGLYGDRHWMSDETMDFLVKLGCACDYIDSDRSYRISWHLPQQWIGAHDSIHAEIKQLIVLMDQAVKDGRSELCYTVKHNETLTFLTEADAKYSNGMVRW